jgi:polar amino acid transport system substrate-binding protein
VVRAPTSRSSSDTMVAQNAEVRRGVKPQLEADAKRVAGVRLLDGRFIGIEQAMATPRQRAASGALSRGVRRGDESRRVRRAALAATT